MRYIFEDFSLDLDIRELRREGKIIPVEPQVFDLLAFLIEERDRVVAKDDLIVHVWKGRIVSDSALSSRITAVRQAINDSGDEQRLIRTIARKGVRFVGEVSTDSRKTADTVSAPAGALRLPAKPSIAVLPFKNLSGDPEQEYFSDGMTEDVITSLSRLRWLFVIARNSTFIYKGRVPDLKQLASELGVGYVLDGSVRKSGQRVRITAQLIDASTGSHIWSDRFDRELSDIFALQDEITTSVTAAIEPKLLAAEGLRTEKRAIADLNAWDLVARAVSLFWKLTAADNATAITLLRQAVERFPDYAPAHSMLAFALLVSGHVGWLGTAADAKEAERSAQRAVELDENDPWAHLALGYLAFVNRQTDDAVRRFQAALDLNPNFAAAHGYVAWALAFDGRSEEAIGHANEALRMSPRDPLNCFFFSSIAAAHYMARRYPEAGQAIRLALQQRPGLLLAHRMLCASLGQAGQTEEAKAALAKLRELHPNLSLAWVEQNVPYTSNTMPHFLEGLRKAGLT